MLLVQDTTDITKNPAYEFGYSVGYFVGENSTLILILTGLALALFLVFLLRKRRNRLKQDR